VPLEDTTPEHIFFNYVAQAYSDFLAGADDFGELQTELNRVFGKTLKVKKGQTKIIRRFLLF